MLVLSRQRDESIIIGDNIVITIVDIRGDKVRLGIEAPTEIPVHRQEVYEAIQRENAKADAEGRVIAGRPRRNPARRLLRPRLEGRERIPPKSAAGPLRNGSGRFCRSNGDLNESPLHEKSLAATKAQRSIAARPPRFSQLP